MQSNFDNWTKIYITSTKQGKRNITGLDIHIMINHVSGDAINPCILSKTDSLL